MNGKTGVVKADAEKKDNSPSPAPLKRNESTGDLFFTGGGTKNGHEPSESTGTALLSSEFNNSTGILSESGNASEKERSHDDYVQSTLKNHLWYHGMMFGSLVEKLLKWENSYLVRRTIDHKSVQVLCISTRVEDKVFHYHLDWNDEGWSCPKLYEKFPKIPPRRYAHVHQMLDAWSLVVNFIVPVARNKMVVHHESINLGAVLGSGAFGEVRKAQFLPPGATESIEVAVKRATGETKRTKIQEFCHEARIMAILRHENVIALYGIASLQQPLMLVMEFLAGGDMKKYLRTTPNIPNRQIIAFAMDVARGMRHLAEKKVVHRDLAARNCLLSVNLRVKIADFGLSAQTPKNEIVVKKLEKAPIRWLAPETLLKGIFNERTDVWSYGVLLTELMTRCARDPLYRLDKRELQKLIKETDHPHSDAGGEPRELLDLVNACTERNAANRINFQTVKRRVTQLYDRYGSDQGAVETAKCIDDLRKNRSAKGGLDGKKSMTTLQRKKSKGNRERTAERKSKNGKLMSYKRKESRARLPPGM